MSFYFSYDIEDDGQNTDDRRRINIAFERFGWERIGGSSWQYPPFGTASAAGDDFMNKVLPAMFYFRSLAAAKGIRVPKYTFRSHSEGGLRDSIGFPISSAAELELLELPEGAPSQTKLSSDRLRKFITQAEHSLM